VNTTVVACCQLTPVLGDPAANRELTADAITYAAAGRGAGVVVLPELVSSGYVFHSRAEVQASAETADGPTLALWARLAEATMTAGPITITAECRLGDALSKAVSPANDVHADRRPELYRRIAEQAIP